MKCLMEDDAGISMPARTLLLGYILLLRGIIVNRTYGIHKNLFISPFSPTIFGPINYGPP